MSDPSDDVVSRAVNAGFTPLPLWPRTKRPMHSNWTESTPENAQEAFSAARSLAADRGSTDPLNIGLRLGDGIVDIDLDHHLAVSLAPRVLPPTPMRHGRASARNSHWWYRVTDYSLGVKPYKLPGGKVIIEYRSTGGQTMIPPSYNADHDETAIWEGEPFGGAEGPAEVSGAALHARVALIALLVAVAERWPRKGGRHDAYLALVGGLLRDADENGDPRLQPFWDAQIEGFIGLLTWITHDEDGAGSRVAESVPSTRRKILRGDRVQGWPTLARHLGDDGEDYVEVIRRFAADIENLNGTPRNRITRRREEDEWYDPRDEPATVLRAVPDEGVADGSGVEVLGPEEDEEGPEPEQRGTWSIVTEHDKWLDEHGNLISPVLPGVLHRTDGVGLFYPGRINLLYGPSESGKSLIAMQAALEVIGAGGRALMIDLENGYDEIHERLVALGFPDGQRTPGWGYIEAEQPIASLQRDSWGQESHSPTGRANRERFRNDLARFAPDLIIVDGTTTLFTMHGLDPNRATGVDTITTWLRTLCHHGERTILMLDHTNKNPRPGDLPTGSQHKKSMVQGTMLQVHGESPEVGEEATTFLYAVKDRPGKVKREGYKDNEGIRVADVTFHGRSDGTVRLTVEEPDPDAVVMDLSGTRPPGRPKADTSGDERKVLGVFRQAGVGTLVTRADVEKAADGIPTGRIKEAIRVLLVSGAIEQQGAGRSTAYVLRPEAQA